MDKKMKFITAACFVDRNSANDWYNCFVTLAALGHAWDSVQTTTIDDNRLLVQITYADQTLKQTDLKWSFTEVNGK